MQAECTIVESQVIDDFDNFYWEREIRKFGFLFMKIDKLIENSNSVCQ